MFDGQTYSNYSEDVWQKNIILEIDQYLKMSFLLTQL